jgi:hypothetical protein
VQTASTPSFMILAITAIMMGKITAGKGNPPVAAK